MGITTEETGAAKAIMVVEDEGLIALDLKTTLERFGYTVPGVASTCEEALRLTETCSPDLILMDIHLNGRADGIEAAETIRKRFDVPVIFLTAHADAATLGRARLTEPFGYIVKPFAPVDVRAQIETALYRHEIEHRLRKSEAWFSATLRSIGEGVITTGPDGQVEFMNPAAEHLTGWSLQQAKRKHAAGILHLVDSGGQANFNRMLENNADLTHESAGGFNRDDHQLRGRDGLTSTVQCEVSINKTEDGLLGTLIVLRDVTAQRQMEKTARRNAMMEAISIMAGSLAHDFNNLLTVILGYAEVIQSDPDRKCVEGENILRAGQECARLSSQLLTISRGGLVPPVVLDLNAVTLKAVDMLQHVLGPGCSLSLSLSADALPVRAVEAELQQILVTLAVYARKSMLKEEGSQLRIATTAQSGLAVLDVSDTGLGINQEAQDRVFEPSFNRSGGSASGLAMTTVYSLVAHCGGTIEVKSERRNGTRFRILLPLAVEVPEHAVPVPPQESAAEEPPRSVLIVDPSKEIRTLLRGQFVKQGFTVLEAESSHAALAMLKVQKEPLKLLLTDVLPGDTTGPELFREFLKHSPLLRAMFVSGYRAEDLKDYDLYQEGRADFMRKPMFPQTLLLRCRALLEQTHVFPEATGI